MASERDNKYKNNLLPSFQFIVNPSAGQGRYERITHIIHEVLSRHNLQYDIKILQYRGEATFVSREAAGTHDIVVAVGGDGTVNEVFNGLVQTRAAFGIIPAGTGNGFARAIGVPLDPVKACQVLVDGNVRSIDVGKVNDRFFLGTAGIGFDAMISRFVVGRRGRFRGMWLYFVAGAYIFQKYIPQLVDMEIDSSIVKATPLVVAVANTALYGGRALIAPSARPDDGLLDVCVIQKMKAIQLLWHLPKLFTGKHILVNNVTIYKCKKIVISASEPIPVHVDGEAMEGCLRVEFAVLPDALKVLVPKESEDSGIFSL